MAFRTLSKLLGGKPEIVPPRPTPSEVERRMYMSMRDMALAYRPSALAPGRNYSGPVYGVLTDFGFPHNQATLAALSDGTVSLYYSTGGGILGTGTQNQVWEAAEELLLLAPDYLAFCPEFKPQATLPPETVQFCLLGSGKIWCRMMAIEDLAYGEALLSPLFAAANDLLEEVLEHRERNRR